MSEALVTDEIQTLFNALPDVVFFVKDREGRYTHCNLTLIRRIGRKRIGDVVGRSAEDLFPAPLGTRYLQQDRRVLRGEVLENQLEVHLYPNRLPGWCLTFKRPILAGGSVVGVLGISRDLGQPDKRHSSFAQLEQVVSHMYDHYAEAIRVAEMARIAGISVAQLERLFHRVFQLTPQQFLTKIRIESAMRQLRSSATIASIGQACGFCDQSAFSRQFRAVVGVTPRDYRTLRLRSPSNQSD
ncbi:AraC family transcriptional regulator [Luteimonas aquatica]|uniref:AraC family transcriptional regulator n=1 Tax=Luteimonas aquatica TaxID=450364 RepID=UPI001F5A02CF|nr:AraC family transcriptional regulator [Luteimonas aquatica]